MNQNQIELPAVKGGFWTWAWRFWIDVSFRKTFAALHWNGVEADLAAKMAPHPGQPTIFASNHCGWWDGFVARLVMEKLLGYDGFVPMEAKNLRRFPTMTRLGAFGLDRDNPRAAMGALKWASETLTAKERRALWIFSQGELLPQDTRPLVIEGGTAWVAERIGARIVPVAIRYEMRDLPNPEVFISLGEPIQPTGQRRETTQALETSLGALVNALRDDVANDRFDRSRPAIQGGRGVDAWWEGVKAAFGAPNNEDR